jgi:hypothetical protein
MQLEHKGPRHANCALDGRQLATNGGIDVPNNEAGHEYDWNTLVVAKCQAMRGRYTRAPSCEFLDVFLDHSI